MSHEGAQRLQQVTCNVAGRDVASFSDEVKRRISAQVSLPSGMFVVYTGSAQAESQAKRELLVHSLLAAAGIVLLLALLFGSGRNLLLILANLPFALVGGVLAVFATGGMLSVGSLVGGARGGDNGDEWRNDKLELVLDNRLRTPQVLPTEGKLERRKESGRLLNYYDREAVWSAAVPLRRSINFCDPQWTSYPTHCSRIGWP